MSTYRGCFYAVCCRKIKEITCFPLIVSLLLHLKAAWVFDFTHPSVDIEFNLKKKERKKKKEHIIGLSCRKLEKRQQTGEAIELTEDGRPTADQERKTPLCDCTCFGLPRRYIIAMLSGLGFCISFGIRCNLGVAIVSMVNNHTIHQNGKIIIKEVRVNPAPLHQHEPTCSIGQ